VLCIGTMHALIFVVFICSIYCWYLWVRCICISLCGIYW